MAAIRTIKHNVLFFINIKFELRNLKSFITISYDS